MLRVFALAALLLAPLPFQASVEPLRQVRSLAQLKQRDVWHRGCPVPLSDLRLLTVSHARVRRCGARRAARRQRGRGRTGAHVFRRLYRLHYPIRHLLSATRTGREVTARKTGT